MAFAVMLKPDNSIIDIDADEHSIEQAISTGGLSCGSEVIRFWQVTPTAGGRPKRDLVAVIPFDQVLLLQRFDPPAKASSTTTASPQRIASEVSWAIRHSR